MAACKKAIWRKHFGKSIFTARALLSSSAIREKLMWKRMLEVMGWSNRQAILCLAFLYLFIVLPFFLEGGPLNNALLWLTGVMLLLYMVETHGLRLETARQNEAAIQPLVIATIEERPQEDGGLTPRPCIVLRNLGRGPALCVLVDDIEIEGTMNGRLTASFEVIDYIEAGHDKVAVAKWRDKSEREGATESRDLASNLDLRQGNRTYNLTVIYEDIDEKPYESVVQLGKGGVRLLRHGRSASRFRQ